MTLGEAKNKVYMLLDEHSAGGEVEHEEDIEKKMTAFFDTAQKLLSGTAKIVKTAVLRPREGKTEYAMPEDFGSLCRIWRGGRPATGRYAWRSGRLLLPAGEREEITVEYFAVPETIPENAPDSYEFQLSEPACQCMPYYVAAQQLLPDLVMDYSAMLRMYELAVQSLPKSGHGDGARLRQSFFRG